MRITAPRGSPRFLATVVLIVLAGAAVLGENIDPDNDGSQHAYGENIGWVNLQPSGAGGPGVHVDDFELTGYLWGENVGWVSLSCRNRSTCATVDYGVRNDGSGNLFGYGWSENLCPATTTFSPSRCLTVRCYRKRSVDRVPVCRNFFKETVVVEPAARHTFRCLAKQSQALRGRNLARDSQIDGASMTPGCPGSA